MAEGIEEMNEIEGDCDERMYTEEEVRQIGELQYAAGAADVASEVNAYKKQLAELTRAGVPEEKFAAYIALAELYGKGEEGFSRGLRQALEMFPLEVRGEAAPRIVAAAAGVPGAGDAWRKMSLAERGALYRVSPDRARAMAEEAGERVY